MKLLVKLATAGLIAATTAGCGPSFASPLDMLLGVSKFEVKVQGDKPGAAFKLNIKADDIGREVTGTVPATFEVSAKSSVVLTLDRTVPEDESKIRLELIRNGLVSAADEKSGTYTSPSVVKVKVGDDWY